MKDIPPLQTVVIATTPDSELPPSVPLKQTLETIRTDAKGARQHTAHTIAELEAWRAEIDATIAFLRANK